MEGTSVPPGISYDLTNQVLLEGSEGVELISYTTSFKSIRFINHSLGEWNLQVRLRYARSWSVHTNCSSFGGQWSTLSIHLSLEVLVQCLRIWSDLKLEYLQFLVSRSSGPVSNLMNAG